MQSNLIRPSQVDSAGRGVMVDSSERGLCSCEGIETTEIVDGNEARQPRVPVRPYSLHPSRPQRALSIAPALPFVVRRLCPWERT